MDKLTLTTPTNAWDAFAALQDGRGRAKLSRDVISKIVVDQERIIAALKAAGVKIEQH